MPAVTTFSLAVLAGAFIALGGMFATVVTAGAAEALPFGVVRLLGGLVFSLGLVLVIVGGAELFTGNNLIIMAVARGRMPYSRMLKNWLVVYVGNFVGAIGTALLVFWSGQATLGDGAVGANALAIATAKCELPFFQALVRGVLCNALVCLAVWLCFSARSTTDRVVSIVLPITAFVAGGFEHVVANMYFIPLGLFLKTGPGGIDAEALAALNWSNFAVVNLVPVTIGNVIGGALLVGTVYWFVYLRTDPRP